VRRNGEKWEMSATGRVHVSGVGFECAGLSGESDGMFTEFDGASTESHGVVGEPEDVLRGSDGVSREPTMISIPGPRKLRWMLAGMLSQMQLTICVQAQTFSSSALNSKRHATHRCCTAPGWFLAFNVCTLTTMPLLVIRQS